MKTILFVCTANICRSPMAAGAHARPYRESRAGLGGPGALGGRLGRAGQPGQHERGRGPAPRGIDLAEHRSQPLTYALLKEADIILVMEEAHRRSIFYMAPEVLAKVYLLTEMAGGHDDVADPFGGTLDEYAATADELAALIDKGLPKILKRIGIAA